MIENREIGMALIQIEVGFSMLARRPFKRSGLCFKEVLKSGIFDLLSSRYKTLPW